MRGRLRTVNTRRHDGRTVTVLTANVCLGDNTGKKNLSVKTTLGSILRDRVGSLTKNVGKTGVDMNIRSHASTRANSARGGFDFHCSRHFFGSHMRVIVNKGISAKTGTAGSTRSFVSGVSLRCHLSTSNAQCIHMFRGGGCRDVLSNRVARANINLILHQGVSQLDRLFVFEGGGVGPRTRGDSVGG